MEGEWGMGDGREILIPIVESSIVDAKINSDTVMVDWSAEYTTIILS